MRQGCFYALALAVLVVAALAVLVLPELRVSAVVGSWALVLGAMEIVSVNELRKRSYEGMDLPGVAGDLLGPIEPGASILMWGRGGSGKSTFALLIAYLVAQLYALGGDWHVLYVSAEEGPGRTAQSRAERLGLHSDRLLISDFAGEAALKAAIEKWDVRFLVLDSVSVIDPGSKDARKFLAWCDRQGVGVIFVAHATKDGTYKGNSRLQHEVYVEVEVFQEEGVSYARTNKNRYAELTTVEVPMTADGVPDIEPPEDHASAAADRADALLSQLES